MATLIQRAVLSDLFFNHEHPNYDGLFDSTNEDCEITREEMEEAVRQDAKDFFDNYGDVCETFAPGVFSCPEDLVIDFFNRL
jgi:hypothetical protein